MSSLQTSVLGSCLSRPQGLTVSQPLACSVWFHERREPKQCFFPAEVQDCPCPAGCQHRNSSETCPGRHGLRPELTWVALLSNSKNVMVAKRFLNQSLHSANNIHLPHVAKTLLRNVCCTHGISPKWVVETSVRFSIGKKCPIAQGLATHEGGVLIHEAGRWAYFVLGSPSCVE